MRNPYTVLGVGKTARAEEIKSAYRQLAKTWHPDQNPGDPSAPMRFAEVAQAYKLLINPDLRSSFDKGDIDPRGRKRPKPARGFSANPFNAFKQARRSATADQGGGERSADAEDAPDEAKFEEMVVHIFGEAAAKQSGHTTQGSTKGGERQQANAPGLDDDPLAALDELFAKWKTRRKPGARSSAKPEKPVTVHQIEITLDAALNGYTGEIEFGDACRVEFTAPPGTLDGAEIRVNSPDPALHGDAIVKISHARHPRLRAVGADLHGEHAISLMEAVLGGTFVFEGLEGPVRITIPEWSGSDKVLRVPDHGLPTPAGPRGALMVHLRVMLPETPDRSLIDLMRSNRRSWYL
ncbi:DnaJ domain-containing protein [Hoeflea sp.]|uniref:DnaJ domain-containing protein n=1 Tax=Hoeflea sp. TaxID=1940281 RepID=UPI003B51C99C